jgi:hypothetical protein
VGAPELPAKERSAHLGALLSGVEGVERGGAQDRTGPLVCHGKGKAGGIGYFGFKQALSSGAVAGSGAAIPAHIAASTKSYRAWACSGASGIRESP